MSHDHDGIDISRRQYGRAIRREMGHGSASHEGYEPRGDTYGVDLDETIWLPREDQLRELLGDYFLSLDYSSVGYVVSVRGPGRAFHTAAEATAAEAYGRALVYVRTAELAVSR